MYKKIKLNKKKLRILDINTKKKYNDNLELELEKKFIIQPEERVEEGVIENDLEEENKELEELNYSDEVDNEKTQKALDLLPKNGTPFEIYRSLLKKTTFQHYRNLCLSDSAKISLVIVTQIYFSLRFKAIC